MEVVSVELLEHMLKTSPFILIFIFIIKILWNKYLEEVEYIKSIIKSNEEIFNELTEVIQSLEKQNLKNTDDIQKDLIEHSRKIQSSLDYISDRIIKKIDNSNDES